MISQESKSTAVHPSYRSLIFCNCVEMPFLLLRLKLRPSSQECSLDWRWLAVSSPICLVSVIGFVCQSGCWSTRYWEDWCSCTDHFQYIPQLPEPENTTRNSFQSGIHQLPVVTLVVDLLRMWLIGLESAIWEDPWVGHWREASASSWTWWRRAWNWQGF